MESFLEAIALVDSVHSVSGFKNEKFLDWMIEVKLFIINDF